MVLRAFLVLFLAWLNLNFPFSDQEKLLHGLWILRNNSHKKLYRFRKKCTLGGEKFFTSKAIFYIYLEDFPIALVNEQPEICK